jgi:hypothetical protein
MARDWPRFEGTVRLIALRSVPDLAGDEATRERRARACWASAKIEWKRISKDEPREIASPTFDLWWPL